MVYARVHHYTKGYGVREIYTMRAQSLLKLRANIVFRMEHPGRYYPGLDPDALSFDVSGNNPGTVMRKNKRIVWIDRNGAYHGIRSDGSIGPAYTSDEWYR